MVQAWIYDAISDADQREPHKLSPNIPVSLEELKKIGVLHWEFNIDHDLDACVDSLMRERSYQNKDMIAISKDTLPNYDEKLKSFFAEHLHDDEEIRLIIEGSGYFDVRNSKDEWVRILTTVGDLIVIPAGIYHRFTLDTGNYVKAMRIFKQDPKWTPINRSEEAERNSHRIEYLKNLGMESEANIF